MEEFDFDHARGLKRDLIAHLGTLDFVLGRENVVFLGPQETISRPSTNPFTSPRTARMLDTPPRVRRIRATHEANLEADHMSHISRYRCFSVALPLWCLIMAALVPLNSSGNSRTFQWNSLTFQWGASATITPHSGRPWRPGNVPAPGYTNHVLRYSPVLNSHETTMIRSLPGVLLNIDEYTEPVYYSTTSTARRTVNCVTYGCVGGTRAPITGDEWVAPGTDGQLVIVDTKRRRTYELWQATRDSDGTVAVDSDGSVTAGSMSIVDLDGRGNKTADGENLNITGAGVSRMFGLIRANEIKAAATSPATAIPHALQVSLPAAMNCAEGIRRPATKTDGQSTSTSCVQEGARFQLAPRYNCRGVPTKLGQAACYAMKKYGAYNMDNNGSTYMLVYGQHMRSWATGITDYAEVGIWSDYQNLGLPTSRMRSLARWFGR